MSIYLDHNATTALDDRVLEVMLPYFKTSYGNPSSVHSLGRVARSAIEMAREQVAQLVHAHPQQVIFTSGGTEANNLAIKGLAGENNTRKIAVGVTEHSSVIEVANYLSRRGDSEVSWLPVDAHGIIKSDSLYALLQQQSVDLVSVMMANNETGVVQDITSVAKLCRAHGALLHSDVVQAAGKMKVDMAALGVHAMSLSAHKIYGPKGAGALVIDKQCEPVPLMHGGGHENNWRSGTENVAGIVGFGKAAELAASELEANQQQLLKQRKVLEAKLKALPGVEIIAESVERLPNTVMIVVPDIEGETLLMNLDRQGICVSSGSACASDSDKPNHVLAAMGADKEKARSAVRISLGIETTAAECETLVATLSQELKQASHLKAAII